MKPICKCCGKECDAKVGNVGYGTIYGGNHKAVSVCCGAEIIQTIGHGHAGGDYCPPTTGVVSDTKREGIRRIVRDHNQEEAVEMLIDHEFCVSKAEAKRVYVQVSAREGTPLYWERKYTKEYQAKCDLEIKLGELNKEIKELEEDAIMDQKMAHTYISEITRLQKQVKSVACCGNCKRRINNEDEYIEFCWLCGGELENWCLG